MWDSKTIMLTGGMAMLAYIIGSINNSLVAARLFKLPNVRSLGSGNPGATNLLRTAGIQVALPVLLADLAKAWAVVRISAAILAPAIAPFLILPLVFGNLFPLFHNFRGGKGVAATVGGMLALNPWTMLLGGCCFLLVFAITRRVSAGSITMVLSYPIISWTTGQNTSEIAVTALLAVIILITHRKNIHRLFTGREPAIGASRGDGK